MAVAAPDDRGSLHARVGRRDGRDRELPRTPRSTSAPRRQAGADAIHPGLRLPRREPRLRGGGRGGRARLRRARRPRRSALGGDKLEAKRIAARGRRPGRARRASRTSSASADRQGGGRRRRPRDARRPRRRPSSTRRWRRPGARRRRPSATTASSSSATSSGRGTSRSSCSPTAHGTSSRSASASARSSGATRRCSRSRPSPALDPELRARDERCGGRASRRAIGYRSAGTAEFMLDGARLLLPRAERPDPGRAPGHRARHRASTSSRSSFGSPAASRSTHVDTVLLSGHAVEVRLYAEDPRTFLPQAGRIERLRLPTRDPRRRRRRGGRRGRRRLRPDDREADRARPDARRGARPAARRARRDRGRGRDDEPPVPPLARLASRAVRAGRTTTAFLTDHPPLSEPPLAPAERPVGRRLAAQPALAPARTRRPTSTRRRTPRQPARRRAERADGADARNGDPRAREAGRPRRRTASRCSSSRR